MGHMAQPNSCHYIFISATILNLLGILMQRYINQILLVFFFNITILQAAFTDVTIGAGLIDEHIGLYQTNTNGDKNKFNYRVLLEAQTFVNFSLAGFDYILIPSFGFQFPKSTEESAITKYSSYLGLNLGYNLSKSFLLQGGTSFYMTYFTTDGGTTSLPNGNNPSQEFPLPEESSMATNITTNIALQYFLDDLSFKAQGFVFNLMNSRNRTYTYALTMHYHFGTTLWED
jgi:hypothetical protein